MRRGGDLISNIARISCLSLFFLCITYNSAEGKEVVRVAILTNQKGVTIGYKDRLIIKTQSGKRMIFRRINPLRVSSCKNGILIHKRCIQEDRVKLIPIKEGLVVKDREYGGIFDIIKRKKTLLVINRIDIEEYLKGVVPREMPSNWNMEALKAQAVVARTYALYQKNINREREFDLFSTTSDQVYGGRRGENLRTDRAVSDTKGLILTYKGDIILSVYHSTSAGPTEDAEEVWSEYFPYLRGVACPFDKDSPYYSWKRKIKIEDIEGRLQGNYPMGIIATITPYRRSKRGRVMGIRILHSEGELFLTGKEFRRIIGYTILPSTNFEIMEINSDLYLSGKGAGHGLGLCQWGTKGMSDLGYSFDEILRHYYPGTRIVRYRHNMFRGRVTRNR